MTIAIGTDIVEVKRIADALERQGDKFVQRILTESEIAEYRGRGNSVENFWRNALPPRRRLPKHWALVLVAALAFNIWLFC